MAIYCPKCTEETGLRVKAHPMDAFCPECGTDFTQVDESFVQKMNVWITERIEAGDLSGFKGRLLLQLASQFVRSTTVIDLWPREPSHVNTTTHDEENFHFSAGNIYKMDEDGAALSFLSDMPALFPFRAGMDDPYIRVLIREDVPILESNLLLKKLLTYLAKVVEAMESDLPPKEKSVTSTGQYGRDEDGVIARPMPDIHGQEEK